MGVQENPGVLASVAVNVVAADNAAGFVSNTAGVVAGADVLLAVPVQEPETVSVLVSPLAVTAL